MEGGERAIGSMGLSEEVKEKNVKEREGDDAFKGVKKVKRERGSTAKERISKMPPCAAGKRSSIYRGVTRHRWTGRYEAHLWDKDSWSETQNKKGKQVYLGAYDEEEAAARAYDLAALKYWGPGTNINFPVSDYSRDIEEMQRISREDYLASLRRKSSGSTRGLSKYRLAKQHSLKWETGAGRILGNKYFSPGSCSTSEEAYERAQGDYGSYGTFKNIDLSNYVKWWHTNKGADFGPTARRATEESNSVSDEKSAQGDETETSEWPGQASQIGEPYQLPLLGVRHNQKYKPSSVTALGILSQSTRFKQVLEKVSAKKEGSQSKNEKVLENAQMEKGKGKLTLPEEMVASKESKTVFGAPHTSEDVNTMFPFREGQPIASIHEGNTSNTINDSLWSSFGAKTSGIGLTNSVSIC